MISDEIEDVKLPLPKFLKLFTNNNVPVPKAMAVAGKMSVVIPTPSISLIMITGTTFDQLQGI